MLIGGLALMKGYLNRLDEQGRRDLHEGWFQTGDIARWDKDGTLSLIESGQVAGRAST
jgi:long-subunit acyl-CoA synthetase (AMP-forming)